MECRKIPWPSSVTEKKYCIEDSHWPSKDFAYECKINLLTGRTHQVRSNSFFFSTFSFSATVLPPLEGPCGQCAHGLCVFASMCSFKKETRNHLGSYMILSASEFVL